MNEPRMDVLITPELAAELAARLGPRRHLPEEAEAQLMIGVARYTTPTQFDRLAQALAADSRDWLGEAQEAFSEVGLQLSQTQMEAARGIFQHERRFTRRSFYRSVYVATHLRPGPNPTSPKSHSAFNEMQLGLLAWGFGREFDRFDAMRLEGAMRWVGHGDVEFGLKMVAQFLEEHFPLAGAASVSVDALREAYEDGLRHQSHALLHVPAVLSRELNHAGIRRDADESDIAADVAVLEQGMAGQQSLAGELGESAWLDEVVKQAGVIVQYDTGRHLRIDRVLLMEHTNLLDRANLPQQLRKFDARTIANVLLAASIAKTHERFEGTVAEQAFALLASCKDEQLIDLSTKVDEAMRRHHHQAWRMFLRSNFHEQIPEVARVFGDFAGAARQIVDDPRDNCVVNRQAVEVAATIVRYGVSLSAMQVEAVTGLLINEQRVGEWRLIAAVGEATRLRPGEQMDSPASFFPVLERELRNLRAPSSLPPYEEPERPTGLEFMAMWHGRLVADLERHQREILAQSDRPVVPPARRDERVTL